MICPPGKSIIFYKKVTEKIELVSRPNLDFVVTRIVSSGTLATSAVRAIARLAVQESANAAVNRSARASAAGLSESELLAMLRTTRTGVNAGNSRRQGRSVESLTTQI